MVGISYPYDSWVHDLVDLRNARVNIYGLDGDFSQVAFAEMMEFSAGGPEALRTILNNPDTAIISEGLADYLAVDLGDVIELQGEGLDNMHKTRVVGIVRRIPVIPDITRSRIAARSRSSVLVSLAYFGRLATEIDHTQPGSNDPMIETVLATFLPDADQEGIAETLREQYAPQNNFWINLLSWQLEQNKSDRVFFVALLLAMTGISFTTAVFAVFAVIYVTIYARRIEIGMLKSMGMLRRQLTGMLIVEAIAMTLGSALAGIVAGASMAYLNYYIDAVMSQMPTQFAVDTIATPAIIVMVVLASVLAAAFSARRIVRKPAVEILRMS
jgi:ABC-type antimicrobial peptide transport system permease subunit